MEPFELGREVQNGLKAEVSKLKDHLMKLTVKYKVSEEKRISLTKKITKLKENCRIHSDKLLNSERNRLLAEYNLFMSEKKMRKLEKRIIKLMDSKKSFEDVKDPAAEKSTSQTRMTHEDEELTGHRMSKESNNPDLIASSLSPVMSETQDDLRKSGSSHQRGDDDSLRYVVFTPIDQYMRVLSTSAVSKGTDRSTPPQKTYFRDIESQRYAERHLEYPDISMDGERWRTKKEEVDILNSRLQVLRSVSLEKGREIEDKKSALKEKEKMVNNIKEEISKIREIMKLKSITME